MSLRRKEGPLKLTSRIATLVVQEMVVVLDMVKAKREYQ
jgi:hypothetical protein